MSLVKDITDSNFLIQVLMVRTADNTVSVLLAKKLKKLKKIRYAHIVTEPVLYLATGHFQSQ